MQDPVGSLTRHAAVAACLVLLSVTYAAAQTDITPAPATAQFMSRYDFHLAAAGLAVDDPRFSWDTHFGGEFDFIDYVAGRAIFMADYQAVLGHELRAFDPNQGNYYLSAGSSVRVKGSEILGVLYHVTDPLSFVQRTYELCTRFAVLDTICHEEPFSGFVLFDAKDPSHPHEGRESWEFHPTYRGAIDALRYAGFREIVEIVATDDTAAGLYRGGARRCFLAIK